MKKADQWSGLVFLITSVLICLGAAKLPYGNIHNPGPGFFPIWIGILLGALSMTLLVKTTRQGEQAKMIGELLAEKIRWGKVFLVLVALLLYAVLIQYAGFLAITFLFIVFLLRFVDPQPWRRVILWGLIGAGGCYLLFDVWMRLRLPKGFFGA
jgi:hypothetical protein